ncbi:MAG TPA: hypothetical protein VGB15_11715 [Longimicrobium sp.]
MVRGVVVGGDASALEMGENHFAEVVDALEANEPVPQDVYPILSKIKAVSDTNKRHGIRSRFMRRNQRPLLITPRTGERLAVALDRDIVTVGSVSGYLEYINLHGDTNTMRLYAEPELGGYVTCKFPKRLAADAAAAVREFVTVYGEVRFRADGSHAYHVKANDIERRRKNGDYNYPFAETAGIAREFVGDRSVEDLIREVRRGW